MKRIDPIIFQIFIYILLGIIALFFLGWGIMWMTEKGYQLNEQNIDACVYRGNDPMVCQLLQQ